MSWLGCLFLLGAVFPSALAAPPSVPNMVSAWIPTSLKPVQQDIYDFLNPFHTPSVTQAFVSCTVLIFLSAVTAGPTVIPYPKNSTRFQAVCLRIRYAVYGLVAPDFFAITSWLRRIAEAYPALIYDRLYNKHAPKKFKWTALHGAFIKHGGFVLWEDGGPTKVLRIEDVGRMVKSGEIEPPALSKQDILARSTRAPGHITVWFLVFPIYWFLWKFSPTLPTFTLIAAMHGWLSWYAYFWRSMTILAVVEPIVLFRKAREAKEMISGIKVDDIEKGASQAPDDSEKDVDTAVADALTSADLSEKNGSSDEETVAVPAKTFSFSLVLKFVQCILTEIFVHIFQLFGAISSPMRVQWSSISSSRRLALKLSCWIAGMVVTLIGWSGGFFVSNKLPFSSEVERFIWDISIIFLALQPFILLLAPRWIRSKVWGSARGLIWIVYNLAYAAARISIFFITVRSIKLAA